MDWHDVELVQFVFEQVAQQAREHSCWYIRFRPQERESTVSQQLLSTIGARPSPMHLTADLTLQLDLTQSSDELLKAMRKNTRSDIRKADRLGIVTKISTDENEIRRFYEEQLAVAEKHHFVPFSYEFLYEQFKEFVSSDSAFLVHAYKEEQLLATAFIIVYNGEAVYHYGVSTEANAKLPGSAAAQWRAITEAQERGCTRYNFWGIAPADQTEHRFAGVSLFKRGFGGEEVAYLPAHDIPLNPLYWVTWVFETYRRKSRHL